MCSHTSPRDQEGYDGDRELPPVATGFRDRDPVATQVPKLALSCNLGFKVEVSWPAMTMRTFKLECKGEVI